MNLSNESKQGKHPPIELNEIKITPCETENNELNKAVIPLKSFNEKRTDSHLN